MEEENVTKTDDAGLQQGEVDGGQNTDMTQRMSVPADEQTPARQVKPAVDRSKTIMSLVIAVLLVAIGVIIYMFTNRQPDPELESDRTGTGGVVITPDSHETGAMQKVAEGMITVKMTPAWYFYDGNSAGNGYVANSQYNSAPLKITVTLDDTGEVVLETDPIPVGYSAENFKLSKYLAKGSYPATVTHALVDEDGEVTNSVRTRIMIYVQN